MHLYSLIGGKCKIRKRSTTSASSYSSAPQSYRFRRAVLINRRGVGGGARTPSASRWRVSSRSPASILRISRSPNQTPLQSGGGGGGGRGRQRAPVSARKLAATLWEMNSPGFKNYPELNNSRKESTSRLGYLPQHLSDPSHTSFSERTERSGNGSYYARNPIISQRFRQPIHTVRGSDSISNASCKQIETRSRRPAPTDSILEVNPHLRDLRNGLTTSKEFLKILSRMWGSEEHYLSGKSVLTALSTEFDRASERVDCLIQEKYSSHKEINNLKKHFEEEKAVWKKKVHERVETAIKSILKDLEMERKLRKRSESLTKTLGRELADAKVALSEVIDQLENEKRVREIMERVSDELARGIGEDRELVEQLKKEAANVREEVEKEREMLHLADVLREERVQMKLTEAKYQFEEKNAAVDKLRSDLEAYLRSKEANETRSESPNPVGKMEVGDKSINTMAAYQNGEMGERKSELEYRSGCKDLDPEDDSSESDLHSIELNVDNNNRNCMWNCVSGTVQEDQKRPSVDKDIKGRKSNSEKMARGRNSVERCTPDGIEWDFNVKSTNQAHGKHLDVEGQRSRSIKDLRDYLASNSKLAAAHRYSSPTKLWGA